MKKVLLIIAILGAIYHFKNNPGSFNFSSKSHDRVILYATSWCGYCKKTRAYFAEHGVLYTEYDIERSAYGKAEYDKVAKGFGVPVVDAKGTIIRGYSPSQYKKALGSW